MKKNAKMSPFDAMMAELMGDLGSSALLEEGMSMDPERLEKVPLRYRIIALGFLQRCSLEELNRRLTAANCAALYARSLWEASLIYAFLHGLSYGKWKKLRDICMDVSREMEVGDPYFGDRSISIRAIKRYIEDSSSGDGGALVTRQLTRVMEEKIRKVGSGEEAFRAFLEENIKAFSPVREKTRYYFCKYLYYMLKTKADEYAAALRTGVAEEEMTEEITQLFKGVTPLKRKKHTPEEARDFLMGVDVSPGGVFDAFNRFYFDYVSTDWMAVLMDEYGSVDSIPPSDRRLMAEHLRSYAPGKYGKLSDDEAIEAFRKEEERREAELDAAFRLDGEEGNQKQPSRVGENTIRRYIKGALDIDRMTLVCFLLFFGSRADLRDEEKITPRRLSEILLSCGYPALREEDDFDYFVLQFLEAEDPVDLLMEEVTYHARREENFYLYRVYSESYSYGRFFSEK